MIQRIQYLEQLKSWKDKHVIKIITGIRRCGKSTLLQLFQDELVNNGVDWSQIISINMEDLAYEHLRDYHTLYLFIQERLVSDRMNYVFIDEIQNVDSFQKAIDSLFLKQNVDIYLTGSNAYLLSGEISTLLSGRFIEIEMLPFSLSEFQEAFNDFSVHSYNHYITTSSFPYTTRLDSHSELYQYLQGVYNTVILKDIVQRNKLQNSEILEKIIKYLCDNIGNLTSLKKVTDSIATSTAKTSQNTIDTYVIGLLNSYMFYKVPRYDIHGKELLRIGHKYYVVDIGIRNMLLGIRPNDFGHILENVVFLELKRKGFQIFVGKNGAQEIDFVCLKNGLIEYYQVALTTKEENVLQREIAPLIAIKDNFPKFLITLDEEPESNYNGICKINLQDWIRKTNVTRN